MDIFINTFQQILLTQLAHYLPRLIQAAFISLIIFNFVSRIVIVLTFC